MLWLFIEITHLRAMERHLPYGITLSPDASERHTRPAITLSRQAGIYQKGQSERANFHQRYVIFPLCLPDGSTSLYSAEVCFIWHAR